MTNATTIRIALKAEAAHLKYDGSTGASEALLYFAKNATAEELIRFREILLAATDEMLLVHNAD